MIDSTSIAYYVIIVISSQYIAPSMAMAEAEVPPRSQKRSSRVGKACSPSASCQASATDLSKAVLGAHIICTSKLVEA